MRIVLAGFVCLGAAFSHTASADVGLGGYCPVCIVEGGKWAEGSPEITADYDGATYRFPDEATRDMFAAAPEKYVPALDGDCIVCFAKAGKRVPGTVDFAAAYQGRVYLFPGAAEKQAFLDAPADYANADLAADGNCIVCKVKAGKDVPGKPEFTAIHDGLRYLFPSDNERAAFLASPQAFAVMKPAMKKTAMKQPASVDVGMIAIEGRSACAACEFRVHPTKDPSQLGLAVKSDDGSIYVVEGAHSQYAQIYEDRFDQIRLTVVGMPIKSEGNVTWLEPSSVQRVN